MIEKLADSSTDESFKSAMFKVRSVLRGTEKDFLENLDEHIQVFRGRRLMNQQLNVNPIQKILKCINGKNVLSLNYFASHSQQRTDRLVEPLGIFYLDGYWHLIAYCRLRKDYRDFRIDRIKDIQETSETFDQVHPTLKDYVKQWSREMDLQKVIIRVEKQTLPYLDDQKYYNGFVSQKEADEKIEMTFLTSSLPAFAHWYLTFGSYAEIVQPAKLKEKVRDSAEKILQKMVEPR